MHSNRGRHRSYVLFLLLGATVFTPACMTFVSQSFRLITMHEWIEQDLFTPVILWPLPGETKDLS
jgi:hypothetical protein